MMMQMRAEAVQHAARAAQGSEDAEQPAAMADGMGAGSSQDGWEQSLEDDNRFMGYIRDFNEGGGFGFIECPAAKARFGMDVWIHRRQMFGFKVGEEVTFIVARNNGGQPQARHVIKVADLGKLKAKKQASQSRTELLLRQKMAGQTQPSPAAQHVMTEEEA